MTLQREELLTELRRLATDLDRGPTPDELDEKSSYTLADYREEFGSWANALAVADIEQPAGRKIPSESLRAELRRLAEELDKVPTGQEMVSHGHHGINTYKNRFGSWNEALEAADLSRKPDRKERSDQELLAEIERLADELGRTPSSRDMAEHGEFGRITYRDHFGSWNEALGAAGFDRRRPKRKTSEAELVTELQRLADALGTTPTTDDMQRDGEFSPGTYINRFESWSAALEAADLN
jgi:hypothetical protein